MWKLHLGWWLKVWVVCIFGIHSGEPSELKRSVVIFQGKRSKGAECVQAFQERYKSQGESEKNHTVESSNMRAVSQILGLNFYCAVRHVEMFVLLTPGTTARLNVTGENDPLPLLCKAGGHLTAHRWPSRDLSHPRSFCSSGSAREVHAFLTLSH